MKKAVNLIGKSLIVIGALALISECDTPQIAFSKVIAAIAMIGAGYLMSHRDLAEGDNRA